MIEVALLLSVAGNVLLVVLLHLQQRDATAMAERLATRALAAEKVWNPTKELDAEPPQSIPEKTDLEEWAEEQERHKQVVAFYKARDGQIPME
jgi:hypothetical protein